MAGWIAQDSFVGETPDGAWVTVHKGMWVPDGDPLIALDRDGAEQAAKAGVARAALFAPADPGETEKPEPEPEPAPAKEAAAPRKGAATRKGT
jgi:pyruvate/2-oxoglutarate dehydrogenase complex dihydrolipoamide acyltransferase (E2) component